MLDIIHVIILLLISNNEFTTADNCDINITGSGYNNLTDIHIIGFFPCTDPNDTRVIPVDNCDGIERIPIMKLALEEINEKCDLLPGYRLVVDYANSACSSIPAVYHLIQQTDPSKPTKLMILGPACSIASELMGSVAEKFLHIPQVAYTASSPVFGEDKDHYPRFYRVVPVIRQVAEGCVAVVEKLHWKRIAIITGEDEFYYNIGLHIAQKLTSHRVLTHESFIDDPSMALKALKELNARIIIAWIPHSVGIKFWCMAVKEKLTGPDFVWILPPWFSGNWWMAAEDTDCTAEEMRKALEHSLGVTAGSILDNDLSRVLASNKNVKQFKQELLHKKSALATPEYGIALNIYYVYDAVWTIALALNSSISILEERRLGRLEDFTYSSTKIADVFTEAIANVSFEGISGKVSFQKTSGNRKSYSLLVLQYRGGNTVTILIHHSLNGSGNFIHLPNQSFIWQGGYIPKDGPVPGVQSNNQFEVIITFVVTSFGILLTSCFLFFNIYYRNHQVVKRSSYRLNSLILIAVFIGFTGTLLFAVKLAGMGDTTSNIICNIRHWMTELAFVVCFGTLYTKIWRLYKVFLNKRMEKRKYLQDQFMLVIITCIMAPTLFVLIIQTALFPMTLHSHVKINEDNLAVDKIYYLCEGEHYLIFEIVLFTGKILLALLSTVMAFKTKRHVPADKTYRKFYESAVINVSTMLVFFLSTICEVIIILFLLNNIQNGLLLIITLRECFWLYPVIFILFTPKVYRIYHEILWPRKEFSQQASQITQHTTVSLLSKNSKILSTVPKWRRKGLSNSASLNSSNDLANKINPPQQSAHRMVTFDLNSTGTQASNMTDALDSCVFTNVQVVNETAAQYHCD